MQQLLMKWFVLFICCLKNKRLRRLVDPSELKMSLENKRLH